MRSTTTAIPKANGSQSVSDFMARLEYPLKPAVEALRQLILHAHPDLTEQIKWNAPSFSYLEQDRITLNLQGKGFLRVIFHCGAKASGKAGQGRLIEDASGLLEWPAD